MKDAKYLLVTYCDPYTHLDEITLTFKLRSHPVVNKWLDRVGLAQQTYEIDDPSRFYGFGPIEQQQEYALGLINNCIDVINNFEPIIGRRVTSLNDQDTLNYLHHIFEVYHGLPKTETLALDDYQWFESAVKFGTVYLNYVEIGKTLEDLAFDNDQYISDDAFKPFEHYSADFNVKFWTDDSRQVEKNDSIIKAYYNKNEQFFKDRNLDWDSPQLTRGWLPLADLVDDNYDTILSALEPRQYVKSVLIR